MHSVPKLGNPPPKIEKSNFSGKYGNGDALYPLFTHPIAREKYAFFATLWSYRLLWEFRSKISDFPVSSPAEKIWNSRVFDKKFKNKHENPKHFFKRVFFPCYWVGKHWVQCLTGVKKARINAKVVGSKFEFHLKFCCGSLAIIMIFSTW